MQKTADGTEKITKQENNRNIEIVKKNGNILNGSNNIKNSKGKKRLRIKTFIAYPLAFGGVIGWNNETKKVIKEKHIISLNNGIFATNDRLKYSNKYLKAKSIYIHNLLNSKNVMNQMLLKY